ncbi:hypothetical protein MA16_Dca003322 [Dendrobium catenatum]|uniref:Uncharacterized protein n=1 Tax=Dendrobium catenatum TaxID=906689 RepID=A0A2I0XCE0_9ASPA|nr:hypothetical protein MA16_Dca003322 [Dendrobium catenatum]
MRIAHEHVGSNPDGFTWDDQSISGLGISYEQAEVDWLEQEGSADGSRSAGIGAIV